MAIHTNETNEAKVDAVNLWTTYFHASKVKGRGLIVPLIVCAWQMVHITFLVDLYIMTIALHIHFVPTA